MKIVLTLDVEDYVYQFYQRGAEALNRSPEELMQEAVFRYAGIVAQELMQNKEATDNLQINENGT